MLSKVFRPVGLVLGGVFLPVLVDCGGPPSPQSVCPLSCAPSANYHQAVELASKAPPGKTVRVLPKVMSPELDPSVFRASPDGHLQVKVVSISNYPSPAKPKDPNVGYISWVTITPELKRLCKGTAGLCRANELLGLSPQRNKLAKQFWVNVDDLRRPCVSTDVHSIDCPGGGRYNQDVKGAIVNEKTGEKFPFTGRGYSFDWANIESPEGLSEFVILSGATFYDVEQTVSIDDYCRYP